MTPKPEQSTPTIYDVAREAGVARATVDRVIYKRGGVSAKTAEKVSKVIERNLKKETTGVLHTKDFLTARNPSGITM